MSGVIFNRQAANRIIQTVKTVERMPRHQKGRVSASRVWPPPSPLATFRVTDSSQDANDRFTYTAKRQAAQKTSEGYGGWADDPNDTDDYTLYALAEEGQPGSTVFEEGDYVAAVRAAVEGGDPEWWIVGASGEGLPPPTQQYQVLKADHSDPNDPSSPLVWKAGWVRAVVVEDEEEA